MEDQMNYCRNCGAPLVPGNRFCTKCGAPVEEEKPQGNNSRPQSDDQQYNGPQPQQTPPFLQESYATLERAPRKPANKGLIIGMVVAVCVVLVLIFGIYFYRHSYNLNDYIKVKYTGYQNYGTAEAGVNTDKISNKLEKMAGISDKDLEDYNSLSQLGGDFKKALVIENFVDSIEPVVKSSSQGTLTNGDTVKIQIKYSKASAKKLGLHIFGDTKTVKVKGLEKGKVKNPFDAVTVSFSGALPYLTPEISVGDNSGYDESEFTITSDDGQENGNGTVYLSETDQEFTVTFNRESDPNEGFIYAPTEKKYKVGKADTYVKDPSELTTTDRKQLVGHAKKYLRDDYSYEDGMKFLGCITEIANTADSFDDWAQMTYVIFSYDYEDWDDDTETRYTYVSFPDVSHQSDGTLWYDSGNGSANLYHPFEDYDDLSYLYSDIASDGYQIKADSSLKL